MRLALPAGVAAATAVTAAGKEEAKPRVLKLPLKKLPMLKDVGGGVIVDLTRIFHTP